MTCIDEEPLDCIKKLRLALSITDSTESGFAWCCNQPWKVDHLISWHVCSSCVGGY
jgi:hypothetical protein